jgi:predicted Zn-dependent protease
MAGLGLLIAVPVTIAVRGGADADEPAPTVPELPEVGGVEFDRDLGVELRLPNGWERKREKEAVVFESPDGTTLIAISTPGPAEHVSQIQTAAIDSIKSRYRAVEVGERIKKQRLGGRPAQVAAISARHPKKRAPLRILVATAKGEKRAYLVEIFASGASALVDAQVLLNNLALEG